MSGDGEAEEDRPLTRREARAGETAADDVGDGTPEEAGSSGRLSDAVFPAFDASAIPPRPPLPPRAPSGDAESAAPSLPAPPPPLRLPAPPPPAPAPPPASGTPSGSAAQGAPVRAGAPGRGARHEHRLGTGDRSIIREQWHAAREELESHVSHAKDHFDQANERIKQRTGRDLLVAILIGVGFGAVLLASLLIVKWLFVPIALAAALLGVYELGRALRGAGRHIDMVPQLIGAGLIVLSGYFADAWLSWVVLFASVAFVVVWRMLAQMIAQDGRTYGDVLSDVLVGGFIQVYVPFLASVALMLLSRENGEWWVLSFIIVAVVADTCAYAAGLAFGRHPMAPRISPKKTWEGFAGAVLGSLLAGVLLAMFLLHVPWWTGLILGAAILLSATLGDLGESMLKRDLGIKDMSSWLPGHGGLLDRLDSILPSTVPALALYLLFAPWTVA
ncbi:phosphatidate cytidylyltransferase [Microbacterium neungamense]|uniref:phosphatidate cytidylyltransferase n=1 Tax=Microbacterium neungamense TaxID=2810535 RepID=UPI00217D223B|nr:phosphatidate cytidylyltransferase [Microbacterium neungamense]UWF78486.1 phosphatidate cytidylyltransferase [Microbacterium neungamense]